MRTSSSRWFAFGSMNRIVKARLTGPPPMIDLVKFQKGAVPIWSPTAFATGPRFKGAAEP